jgi:acetylornithine deacetylase/succinyl-diaminopimelate desuccinylase-like protein
MNNNGMMGNFKCKRGAAGDGTIYERPAELLQNIIRFDTTNPPGNEAACVAYINGLLQGAGFETAIFAKTNTRPNLIARLAGQGKAAPLMLYGHVDVVTTANQAWTHHPFKAKIVDNFVWGRGALDMKSGVAMMLAAFLRAKAEGFTPAGDIILGVLADEEGGSDFGATYLVENHSKLFENTRYAIGEFGGYTQYVGPKKFYPIQIAEKQICWIKASISGPGGHGSRPMRNGAMANLARFLHKLNTTRLKVHVTPVARRMIEAISSNLPFPKNMVFRQLLNPILTNNMLKLMGELNPYIDPLLHHTVNATIVSGGSKVNVIPSEITVKLDGRLLPGFGPDDMLSELRRVVGKEVRLEVLRYEPGPAEPDMGLFDTLAGILKKFDPDGTPMPLLLPAITDARIFSRLGIQTYGFTPMRLPVGFNFFETIHAADERIPVEAVEFGANAIHELLHCYKG